VRPAGWPAPGRGNTEEAVSHRKSSARDKLRDRIQQIRLALDNLERGLDKLPEFEGLVARIVHGIEHALALTGHGVVHAEVVEQLVREHAALLAKDRRRPKKARTRDELPLRAEDLADEIIAWNGPEPLYPWLPKVAGARTELVRAIEDASHRAKTTDGSIRAVLAKLGLDASSEARRARRARVKRDVTT
jgi:hypothetical protein